MSNVQKKRNIVLSVFVLLLGIVLAASCEHTNDSGQQNCGETNNSSAGSSKSHNIGQNCMNCHSPGGSGKGCFDVGGTAHTDETGDQTISEGVVRLYTQPDGGGELRATIPVDAKGNFYTTDAIDFSGGVYPSAAGPSGSEMFMSSKITAGQCNSCHGKSTDALWAQ